MCNSHRWGSLWYAWVGKALPKLDFPQSAEAKHSCSPPPDSYSRYTLASYLGSVCVCFLLHTFSEPVYGAVYALHFTILVRQHWASWFRQTKTNKWNSENRPHPHYSVSKLLSHLCRRSVSDSRLGLPGSAGLGQELDGETSPPVEVAGKAATCLRKRRGEPGKGGEAQEGLTAPLDELEGLRGGERLPATIHLRFSTSSWDIKRHVKCHRDLSQGDRNQRYSDTSSLFQHVPEKEEAEISLAQTFQVFVSSYHDTYSIYHKAQHTFKFVNVQTSGYLIVIVCY